MPSPAPMSVQVSALVPASPETVFALISHIPTMNRYSPETVSTRWLGSATGPAVGAKFKGRNAIGWARWSTKPTITAVDPGRLFAFQVPGRGGPLWTYRLDVVPGGTLVTESMQQTESSPLMIRLIQRWAGAVDRSEHLRHGMGVTLQRLSAAAVARDAAVPAR